MDAQWIKDVLDEGLGESGSELGAITYLMDNALREVFPMNSWDEPKFTTTVIKFKKSKYQIDITADGCEEVTDSHRIMNWQYKINKVA